MTADTNEPHDIEAEQATLGGLILGGTVDGLQSADFYRPAHQLAFEAIEGLRSEGKPVSAISLVDELRRRGTLRKIGGAPSVHTLMEAAPSAAQAPHYGAIVRRLAERRRVLRTADRLHEMALNPGVDIGSIRDLAAELSRELPASASRCRKLVLTPASEIDDEPVVWAWEDDGAGRIPAGSFGLFAGREGTGKSSFLIRLAAQVTKGELDGSFKGKPRAVIYVAVEDSWKYTIKPRLRAAGADLAKVYRAEVETIEGETVTLSLPVDNKLLEQAISDYDVALVALDPLMSAISDNLDTHVNRQVRQALDPLARMADRTGCIVGGIAHFNKSGGTDPSSLITASGAFKDVARFIFAFATDEEDGSSVITQTKNSLGRSNLPSLAYHIVEATVETTKGEARTGRLILDGPSERTVRDVLGDQTAGGGRNEKDRAQEYLKEALGGGPRFSKEIEEEAREAHGISVRTLKRARSDLKIQVAKDSDGKWWMSLPEHEGDLKDAVEAVAAKSAKDAKTGTLGTDGKTAGKSAKGAKSASPGEVGTLGTLGGAEEPPRPVAARDLKGLPAETVKDAKNANAASPGDVGTVGIVDRLPLGEWPSGSGGAAANGDGGRAA